MTVCEMNGNLICRLGKLNITGSIGMNRGREASPLARFGLQITSFDLFQLREELILGVDAQFLHLHELLLFLEHQTTLCDVILKRSTLD